MEAEDRKDLLTYGLAIISYIAIGFVTKKLLTWNLALLYFVVVLEVLPRCIRRVRGRPDSNSVLAEEEAR